VATMMQASPLSIELRPLGTPQFTIFSFQRRE
jgi:hypothetical protein